MILALPASPSPSPAEFPRGPPACSLNVPIPFSLQCPCVWCSLLVEFSLPEPGSSLLFKVQLRFSWRQPFLVTLPKVEHFPPHPKYHPPSPFSPSHCLVIFFHIALFIMPFLMELISIWNDLVMYLVFISSPARIYPILLSSSPQQTCSPRIVPSIVQIPQIPIEWGMDIFLMCRSDQNICLQKYWKLKQLK